MTELKTLKDINVMDSDLEEFNRIGPTPFFHKKLKQLAISHIKHMRREGRDLYNSNIDEKSAIPKLIEIFNITEEDLK